MAQDPDIISLEGMVFFGRHGARKEERSLGQQFEVDVHVEADLSQARTTDNLGDTIDYGEIYTIAKDVIEGPSFNLLERLADEIALRIMDRLPADGVRIKVKKPRLPIHGGVLNGAAVEVRRRRA